MAHRCDGRWRDPTTTFRTRTVSRQWRQIQKQRRQSETDEANGADGTKKTRTARRHLSLRHAWAIDWDDRLTAWECVRGCDVTPPPLLPLIRHADAMVTVPVVRLAARGSRCRRYTNGECDGSESSALAEDCLRASPLAACTPRPSPSMASNNCAPRATRSQSSSAPLPASASRGGTDTRAPPSRSSRFPL
jgi:hypothetical protein